MAVSAQPAKIHLMTKSRRELFALSQLMAAGLGTQVMEDPAAPLVVSVRGSIAAGKKIVSDAMRAHFIGSTALSNGITGKPGYDEYWMGQVRGQEVELAYIDAAWLTDYSNPDLGSHSPQLVREFFMQQRRLGGISFIQNDRSLEIFNQAGIDVWLEKQGQPNTDGIPPRAPEGPLRDAFAKANHAEPENQWIRYLEIKVADQRLLDSPKFTDVLHKMKMRYGGRTPG